MSGLSCSRYCCSRSSCCWQHYHCSIKLFNWKSAFVLSHGVCRCQKQNKTWPALPWKKIAVQPSCTIRSGHCHCHSHFSFRISLGHFYFYFFFRFCSLGHWAIFNRHITRFTLARSTTHIKCSAQLADQGKLVQESMENAFSKALAQQ